MGFADTLKSVNRETSSPAPRTVSNTNFDPRPDLVEDHYRWVSVLSLAWYHNRPLWGLLHGFRCGGARLSTKRNADGQEVFHLDYSSLLDTWDEDTLRNDWLMPLAADMRLFFAEAPAFMREVVLNGMHSSKELIA